MSGTLNPLVNVAHLAGTNGRCMRCGTSLGAKLVVDDVSGTMTESLWPTSTRVIEYECADSRTRFSDDVPGYAVDCVA